MRFGRDSGTELHHCKTNHDNTAEPTFRCTKMRINYTYSSSFLPKRENRLQPFWLFTATCRSGNVTYGLFTFRFLKSPCWIVWLCSAFSALWCPGKANLLIDPDKLGRLSGSWPPSLGACLFWIRARLGGFCPHPSVSSHCLVCHNSLWLCPDYLCCLNHHRCGRLRRVLLLISTSHREAASARVNSSVSSAPDAANESLWALQAA